ncbi:MAG: hypothetical protein ACK587_00385 [Cyanobacteriota bacterium]
MNIIYVANRPGLAAYSGPVQDYIDRVIAADVAAGNTLGLENGVKDAYDVFIRACIDAGFLGTSGGVLSQSNSLIKVAPIMAGAQTIQGALVPLVGNALTRLGTLSGWNYNRKTGIRGNGTDNAINSSRNNNADPQNNKHMAVNLSTAMSGTVAAMGAQTVSPASQSLIYSFADGLDMRINSTIGGGVSPNNLSGFLGVARSTSSSLAFQSNTVASTASNTSTTPNALPIYILARNLDGVVSIPTTARANFFSIGESVNLSALQPLVTTLLASISASIP